jgi:integration host factor subunit alpha
MKLVEALVEIIKSTLESGEDVLITGFGKFWVKDKRERRGRNPATGDRMMLRSQKVVTFRCSSALRNKINRERWGFILQCWIWLGRFQVSTMARIVCFLSVGFDPDILWT